MKKIVSIITSIIILLCMMPISASANAEFVEFEFQIYDDEAFLTKYNGYMDENVTIPETYQNHPVTYIEESVFRNNTVIKTVSIPDTVRYIGYSAFLGCTNLESVTFPENLKTIQAYAFYNCPNLKSVTLDKNVLDIYDKALGYVNDMKTGDDFILDGFKINGYTNSAAEIYANDNEISFISVGVAPLYLYEVEELPGVEEKRARITKYLGVQKTVVVPSEIDGYTIDGIFVGAFRGNSYIENVTIPSSIFTIYDSAFASCNNLKSVTFKSEYISMSRKAFYDCELLSEFIFDPDVPYFNPLYDKAIVDVADEALDGTAYYNNNLKNGVVYLETALVKVDSSVESFTIPDFVRSISPKAFKDCTKLKSIYIPENVSSIRQNAFDGCSLLNNVEFASNSRCYVDDFAFLNCNQLKSIKFPQDVYPSRYSVGYSYEYVESQGCWDYVKQVGFKIYGVKDSEAENLAKRNEFEFIEYNSSSHTHSYDNACDIDCNGCGETRTTKHNYKAATCTKPKTCKVCGVTSGKKLGHNYAAATCTKPKTCKNCGATSGSALGHKYSKVKTVKATVSKNGYILTECSVCGTDKSKTTIYAAKTVKLSTTKYTYNGKTKEPTVTVKDSKGKTISKSNYTVTYASGRKNVGKYKVTVKFKGNYSGTKTLYFEINPAKTTVKKVSGAKKSMKVTITKKTTQVSGYQIQYSTSKKFTSAKTKTIKSAKTTSATIKSLKAKKTYYVRVRTYKTVNGKKYYSGWSSYKSAKTK